MIPNYNPYNEEEQTTQWPNYNPYNKEEQTTQWLKEKGQKDKTTIYKTYT